MALGARSPDSRFLPLPPRSLSSSVTRNTHEDGFLLQPLRVDLVLAVLVNLARQQRDDSVRVVVQAVVTLDELARHD